MRIRKRPAVAVSGQQLQQLDVASGAINSGGLHGVNPPNSSSSHDLNIPPSCLFSQGPRQALLLDSANASGPQRQPRAAVPFKQYICEAATSGRSSRHEILTAKGEAIASVVDVSEVLQANAKCIDKSSGKELASAIKGGELGWKTVGDDIVGSAGCEKDAHTGRPSDPVVGGHAMISWSGKKVLPLELILSSRSRPNRVWKSTNNTEVRLSSNNVTQITRSSMSKLKGEEEEEEAAAGGAEEEEEDEKGPGRRSKEMEAQALTLPDSSKDPEFTTKLERQKGKKKKRNAIRRDLAWLVSSLKGHRRARSVGRGQRACVVTRMGRGTVWAAFGKLMPVVGAGHLALEAKTNKAPNPSLEQIMEIDDPNDRDDCERVEKKKRKTIMKKKLAKLDVNYVVTASTINEEKMKSAKKKTKTDQQPAAQVLVELKHKALKKSKREVEEQDDVAVLERCKRKDGRVWQCREAVVNAGATYCEHHTVKMRENHARNAEKHAILQVGSMSRGKKRRRNSMDGAECGQYVGEGQGAEKSGEKAALLRRRWRKKCKPCMRRLHEIQERAKPAREWEGEEGLDETRVPATPLASSPETNDPHHIQLPECLLNTDPREWRSDFL